MRSVLDCTPDVSLLWCRFRAFEHPEGPSYTTDVCPAKEMFGELRGNVIHSVGRFGIWVFPVGFVASGHLGRDGLVMSVTSLWGMTKRGSLKQNAILKQKAISCDIGCDVLLRLLGPQNILDPYPFAKCQVEPSKAKRKLIFLQKLR